MGCVVKGTRYNLGVRDIALGVLGFRIRATRYTFQPGASFDTQSCARNANERIEPHTGA